MTPSQEEPGPVYDKWLELVDDTGAPVFGKDIGGYVCVCVSGRIKQQCCSWSPARQQGCQECHRKGTLPLRLCHWAYRKGHCSRPSCCWLLHQCINESCVSVLLCPALSCPAVPQEPSAVPCAHQPAVQTCAPRCEAPMWIEYALCNSAAGQQAARYVPRMPPSMSARHAALSSRPL